MQWGDNYMKYGRIKVYYNLKFGFIFCAETIVAGTVMKTVIDPVSAEKPDLTDSQLGKKILETIEKSRNAPPIERSAIKDFKFWQISKIKGFAAFSKKFDCVSIFEEESTINLIRLVRDSYGAYFVTDTQQPFKLNRDMCNLSLEIGQRVRNLLTTPPSKESDNVMSFETVYGRKVFYVRPSDGFADAGDGHTDAYQVFVHEDNSNNVIAFLVDNKYIQLDECTVKKRWEQLYGNLQDFKYRIIRGGDDCTIIEVSAKTKSKEIISNIYCESNGQLEVTAQIDLVDTSENCRNDIFREYNSLVSSIKFV